MKARIDDSGREVELEGVLGHALVWLTPLDLGAADERELRRPHAHVMREVFASNGLERMALGTRLLSPIEEEMRRRGLEADYWSTEHKLRSDLALVLDQLRACDSGGDPDLAARLRREAEDIRSRLCEPTTQETTTPD